MEVAVAEVAVAEVAVDVGTVRVHRGFWSYNFAIAVASRLFCPFFGDNGRDTGPVVNCRASSYNRLLMSR